MRRAVALTALLAALSAGPVIAQEAPTFSADRFNQDVRILSDDSFLGRGIGTEGETKTIQYISEQFAAAGLQPGGPGGSWTQPVTLNRFAVSNLNASLNAGDWSLAIQQGEQAVISTRRPAESVSLQNAELVFVGYGINAPERNWNDFKGQDLTGKILVVLVNDADFEQPELNTFGGAAMTYYGRWTYKYEEAARQHAAGVLIVHETDPASYGWGTVDNSWSAPQFDIVRENAAAERVPLEAWVQRDVAVDLFRRAGLDFEQLKVQARSADFQPVPLTGVTLNANFDVATTQIETANVIGRLAGSTHPDESVLFTAHWDHIGVGDPDANGDTIFNGAVDNATGTAAIIELARAFGAAPRTERSLVFIGFTAEESGLLGSEFYAANPVYPLETTVGGFNIDATDVYGRTEALSVVGYGQSDFDDRLVAPVEAQGRRILPDDRPQAGAYFRSDHFPLAKRGVPMAYVGAGGAYRDEPIAERQARAEEYGRSRYHQAADEWSADWDVRGALEDLDVIYEIGRDLANSRDWPQWRETSEFAPARAASASARE